MAFKNHKNMESKKVNGMGGAKASNTAWKIMAMYLCVLLLGLLAGLLTYFLASSYDLLVVFAIAFVPTLLIHYSFFLVRSTSEDSKLKNRIVLSSLLRIVAVAAAIGFSFLFLNMTDKSYVYLLTAPVVLMIGYIAAIIFEGKTGGPKK